MAALALPIGASIVGFLGNLLGSKKKQEETGTSNTNQTSGSNTTLDQIIKNLTQSQTQATSTTGPNLTPGYQSFINQVLGKYSGMMGQAPITQEQYTTPLIQGINQNADIQTKSANNIMAARGLSTSPVAATTEANIDAQRMRGINQTLVGAPMAVQQMNTQAMAPMANIMSMLPGLSGTTTQQTGTGTISENNVTDTNTTNRGQTTGSTNQTGNVTNTAGGLGDAFGGLGAILAYLYGKQ
jgi:hypothetical protein